MTLKCVHEEYIDNDGLGVCKKCGQVKQYNKKDPRQPPVIITKGDGGDEAPLPQKEHECTVCHKRLPSERGLKVHMGVLHKEHAPPIQSEKVELELGVLGAMQPFSPWAYWQEKNKEVLKAIVEGESPEIFRERVNELKIEMSKSLRDLELYLQLLDMLVDYFAPDSNWKYGYIKMDRV